MSTKPTPTLAKVPASQTSADEVVAILKRDGGLIVTGLLSQELLDKIALELKPFEQPDQIWKGNFFPEATKRICGAVGKSQTLAKEMFLHPLYQEVCDRMLTITKKSRYGDEIRTFVCKPTGNASTTFDIGPGAEAQQLHRDDGVHHIRNPTKQPSLINMLVRHRRMGLLLSFLALINGYGLLF